MGYKKGVFGAKVEGKLRDAFLDATGTIAGDPLAGDQIPVVIAAMKEVKQDEVDAQGSLSLGVRARLAANLFKGMENFPTGIEKLPEMINALDGRCFLKSVAGKSSSIPCTKQQWIFFERAPLCPADIAIEWWYNEWMYDINVRL